MTRKATKSRSSEFPILEDLGLFPAPTKGDGNCLFRALSDQVYGDETHHGELRDKIVSYVRQNSGHFAAFVGEYGESFEQYVSRLAQDGVYGGHIEIVGFAEEFSMPVVIYQATTLYVVEPQNTPRSEWKQSAHIAYHTWEHYSSVRKIGGPQDGPSEIDIPQIGDLPAQSAGSETSAAEVPSWKIDIVMKSVPDANESTVTEMLRDKDYDQVIEELIMKEFEDPQDVQDPQEAQDAQNAQEDENKGEKGDETQDDKQEANAKTKQRLNKNSKQNNASANSSNTDSATPAETKNVSRKELAKQRRADRKERVRAKKTKGRKEDPGDDPDQEKPSETPKVILI